MPIADAFSLIEVVLALGVAALGIIAVVGMLPTALDSSRDSIAQTRAAEIAETVFTHLRAQPFDAVRYVDEQFNSDGVTPSGSGPSALDLRDLSNTSASVVFYAGFVEIPPSSGVTDTRRLRFSSGRQTDSRYKLIMRFNNQPTGMLAARLANGILMEISPLDRPGDHYLCASVVANRNR